MLTYWLVVLSISHFQTSKEFEGEKKILMDFSNIFSSEGIL